MDHLWEFGVQKYHNKKSVAESGHIDLFTIYVDPN